LTLEILIKNSKLDKLLKTPSTPQSIEIDRVPYRVLDLFKHIYCWARDFIFWKNVPKA